jgi:hypothetical protein
VSDDTIDDDWPSGDEEDAERDANAPEPPTKPSPVVPSTDEHEAPTKPKRVTPAMLRLDSASGFDKTESTTATRRSLLNLADGAHGLSFEDEVPDSRDALDLVAQAEARRGPQPATLFGGGAALEMRERHSLGDYSGALVMAESLLDEDPDNVEAQRCAENCRDVLAKMYMARIGPLDRVPFVAVPPEQLRWLGLDHRAGFVLSHVDGACSLEQLLDVSGMPALDTLRILYELAQQRVIAFR